MRFFGDWLNAAGVVGRKPTGPPHANDGRAAAAMSTATNGAARRFVAMDPPRPSERKKRCWMDSPDDEPIRSAECGIRPRSPTLQRGTDEAMERQLAPLARPVRYSSERGRFNEEHAPDGIFTRVRSSRGFHPWPLDYGSAETR